MKKLLKLFLAFIAILFLGYILGPKAPGIDDHPILPVVNSDPEELEADILSFESNFNLKEDNQARIIWANDTLKEKTEYALVYLHGFSASQEEGDPLHEAFASKYGMNAYFARIAGHGIDQPESLLDLTAGQMVESSLLALAIGIQLGEKVVLMGCSTGATLALYLAAHFQDDINGLVLYSPNIDLFDSNAKVLTMPWGVQIARWVVGSPYREWNPPSAGASQYWYTKYRLEGTAALKSLIDETMTEEVFKKVDQPLLMLYYYKNENERDKVVSISRMQEMFDQISTPPSEKRSIPIPGAGHHIITSRYFSKDLNNVKKVTFNFAEEVLQLDPKEVSLK